MQQVYHSNANTNINIRTLLQNNSGTNSELATKFNISCQTVSKWKNRDFQQDSSCRPLNIQYALSDLEKEIAISLRKSTWLPLDEVWEVLLELNPEISRSSVYRTFKNESINTVPQEKRDIAKKFKEYEPGYIHIDVTYLPKFNGKSYYLFVAIDRCTRSMIYWIYENKTAENTINFMDKCLDFFPFIITHILTDNGLEFTNRSEGEIRGMDSTYILARAAETSPTSTSPEFILALRLSLVGRKRTKVLLNPRRPM